MRTFLNENWRKVGILKIIRLIRVTLAVQRLAACCSESVSLSHVPTAHFPPVCTYSLAPRQSSHSASSVVSQTVELARVSFVLFSKYVVEFSLWYIFINMGPHKMK
jgi:hypothetical protein